MFLCQEDQKDVKARKYETKQTQTANQLLTDRTNL